MQLPETFLEKMNQLLGAEYEAWLESFEQKSFRGLRVNTSKLDVEEFAKISPFPLRKIPWVDNGFYMDEEAAGSKHPYYAAGLYYLQEPSAMTPAANLPIEEGDLVLDLCAAPGGKATELAARLRGTGLLVANDISNSRAKGLLKNLELFGASNILVTSETPERLTQYFEGFFDKILIDAPCSGEGMFRKEPSMVKDWMEHGPSYYAEIQRGIVEQADKLLKPGGMILYSTCTFSLEENEGTILHLLRTNPAFRVVPLPDYEGFAPGKPELLTTSGELREADPLTTACLSEEEAAQLRNCVHIFPHRMEGEGHFLALLKKEAETDTGTACFSSNKAGGKKKTSVERIAKAAVCPEWEDFSKLLTASIAKEGLRLYDNKLYLLPEALWNHRIRGLRFLRTGLYLGDVEKKRFEPSQALAMALRKEACKNVLDFSASDSRILRYLKRETLDVEDMLTGGEKNDWYLVCVDGFPLGWGKLVNGSLRNKYYAGWRW